MATFKTISSDEIRTTKTILNQLIDFVAEDVSGSATRKKYKVFVTGGIGPGVTSSLFHTVFDQDYTLQTANELFDTTIGLFSGSTTVKSASSGVDTNGKLLFPRNTLMMREKVNIYSQLAQTLLGDASKQFTAPFSNPAVDGSDNINEALFLTFKRLFVRDGIKRETFAMRFFQSASAGTADDDAALKPVGQENIFRATTSGSAIFTDVGSAGSIETSEEGGNVGNIVNAANTADSVGLLFYDYGVAVLDLAKITSASQYMSGTISAVTSSDRHNGALISSGFTLMGSSDVESGVVNPKAKFIPDFVVSASIDDILEHVNSVRFGTGSTTFLTFQNNTQINSTLYFCRSTADEFNFSTNPTYTDSEGRIVVIDSNQQGIQKSFSFVTTVGLYNENEELMAVAKLSRPVEKNDEKDLTFRVRLDF